MSALDAERDRAGDAGVHCLPIPTPFLVGRVNAYLIEDDPLTLIDSGPNSGKALDELEQALAAHGRRIEDLELIVITHQHMDHLGLAGILARRSGAPVAALDRLAPYLARYAEEADDDDRFAEALMLRHGIPPDVATALRSVSSAYRGWGSAVEVTRPLAPGQELRFRDRTLRVLHRPGHSPSDTVFWDEERRMLLGGDHLLSHISSNPLITRPLPGEEAASPEGERPRALLTYLESLRATRQMPAEVVLGGHGVPVTDHAALIDERFAMHARRARKIRKLIEDQPLTAHEIAHALWGNVAVTQAYLTLSEVLGHMDLLLDEGQAEEHADRAGVTRFAAG